MERTLVISKDGNLSLQMLEVGDEKDRKLNQIYKTLLTILKCFDCWEETVCVRNRIIQLR